MASEPRCSKPGCGALKIVGKPCSDADCPQQWVHHTDTRPAPAATDTGLVTIMRRYRGTDWPDRYPWAFLNESDCQSEPGPGWIIEKLCLQSQAEELLAAERARYVEASQRATNEESLRDTMHRGLRRWKERAEKAEKALEPFALISSEGVIKQETGHVTVITCAEYFHKARAVLGGKPS